MKSYTISLLLEHEIEITHVHVHSKKIDSNKLENIIIILHNDEYWINNCFYL